MQFDNKAISISLICVVHVIGVFGRMGECEVIEVISFKNSDQKPESNSEDVKYEEENKIIEANVTATNSSSNVTKVNCLTDKVYGPVEVK